MKKVLFICTGNTCRSSMAQALAEHYFKEAGLESVEVLSAGLAAFPGIPAAKEAVAVMSEESIDLSGHRAQNLTLELIEQADLILTMTYAHRRYLQRLFPHIASRVHLLKEYAEMEGEPDILDPIGGDREVYRKCAQELKKAVQRIIEKVTRE